MSNLHEKLMKESNWYNTWHSHRGHGLAHWFFFLFVALLITSAVSEGINKNYLSENLNMAAAVVATRPTTPNKASKPISGQYIIVFKDDVKDPKGLANQLTKEYNGQLLFAYTKVIKGFSAKIPDVAINGLRKNPNIKVVEQDQTISAVSSQAHPPSWGLDRVDQSPLPLDNSYTYNYTGAGVNAYIIDTGIRSAHQEFTGRIGNGYSSIADGYGTEGCHWHGTHVAGTLGGSTVGIAKGVTLHSVRVLDCNGGGTWSGVIAGLDWITANRVLPAVGNISIQGGFSQTLNDALKRLIDSGVVVAVAAGNSANDACSYSPSSEPSAITVSASTKMDAQASYSSYGLCTDLYAPGDAIYSSSIDPNNSANNAYYMFANGTSMATPHVAGVAALYLQQNPTSSPSQVADAIITKGTTGALGEVGANTKNILLNSLLNGISVTPSPIVDTQPPTVPSGLTAIATDSTHVNLSWTGSTDNVGTTGYKIFRNTVQIATQPMAGYPTSFTDSTAAAGTTYTYNVSSYDAAGNNSSMSNGASVTTPTTGTPPPSAFLDIINYSVNATANTVTFNWTTNIDSTGSVTYSVKGSKTLLTKNDPSLGTVHTVTLNSMGSNTSISYTINAFAGSSKDSVTGTVKTARR